MVTAQKLNRNRTGIAQNCPFHCTGAKWELFNSYHICVHVHVRVCVYALASVLFVYACMRVGGVEVSDRMWGKM